MAAAIERVREGERERKKEEKPPPLAQLSYSEDRVNERGGGGQKVGRRIEGARSCRRPEVGETPARIKTPDALTLHMHAGGWWRCGGWAGDAPHHTANQRATLLGELHKT